MTGEKNIGEKHTSELVCVIIDEVFLPPKWFRRKMKTELKKKNTSELVCVINTPKGLCWK